MITLFYCEGSEYNTACECLTETVGLTLGEALVKCKTGSLSQRRPLYGVFICIKNLKHLNYFHFKSIQKESESSCDHQTYFSSRELFCLFILVLFTVKCEEIGVHLWIVKTKSKPPFLLIGPLILVVQLLAKRRKTPRENMQTAEETVS